MRVSLTGDLFAAAFPGGNLAMPGWRGTAGFNYGILFCGQTNVAGYAATRRGSISTKPQCEQDDAAAGGVTDAQFQPRLNRRAVPVTKRQRTGQLLASPAAWRNAGGQRGGNAGAGYAVFKQVFTALLQGKLFLMAAT
jgi:hypothetical protein